MALASELQALYAAGHFDEILSRVEFCLPKDAEGEKSDVVHDLLAYLTEEMMEMNKQKQAEIKGFLGWLEEYSGARVEDLTNKTKLRAYYELDFSELLTILKKNKRKLGEDPTSRRFMGDSAPGVRGLDGNPAAPFGADRGDQPADRPGRLQALRPLVGGGRDRGEGAGRITQKGEA